MIPRGASGQAAELPFVLINSITGIPEDSHVWNDIGGGITDELKVQLPGTLIYTNTVISRIVNRTGGAYGYRLTAGESSSVGKVFYYPNVVGCDGSPKEARWEDVVEVSVGSLAAGAISRSSFSQDGLDLFGEVRRGTAQGGGAITIQLDAGASATDNIYNDLLVSIVSGTGTGQSRRIVLYVGATKNTIVDNLWDTIPDATSVFVVRASRSATAILADGSITRDTFAQDALDLFREARRGTAQGGTAGSITLDTGASSTTDAYKFCEVTIVSGTGAGQTRQGIGYNGTTKVLAVDTPWVVQPNATSVYELFYRASGGTPGDIATAVWSALLKGVYTPTNYMNLIAGLLAGPSTDYTTGTIVFRNPFDTSKIVLTGTVDDTGRLTVLIGDLS